MGKGIGKRLRNGGVGPDRTWRIRQVDSTTGGTEHRRAFPADMSEGVAAETFGYFTEGIALSLVQNGADMDALALLEFAQDEAGEEGFYEITHFPGVIGAIDGSHVAIVNAGGRDALRFYYSLNCQLVCDHQLIFTNVVARWYGSAHDSRVFEESELFRKFQTGECQGILLGDPAYTCRQFMLTPFRNAMTPAEIHYNTAQRRTRGVIERAFGIWKKRFPCISKGMHLRCSASKCNLDHNMAIIVATACLHNLARRRHDPLPEPEPDLPRQNLEEPIRPLNAVEADLRGNLFRQKFVVQHFNQ
ncbi:putative nuclease HARBI1 [Liolophura sinensis]|uniref:putative nuclease HARBI1 n=1 Tax=Liolophura sinensis TaxID=3198878 RepID=UPI00315947BC